MRRLIFFISIILIASLISAQLDGLQDSVDNLDENLDGVRDLTEDPETTASNYLKQEWTEILDKSDSGRVILTFSSILNSLDPLFLLILGMEYSLSWAFIFSVVIWITLFSFIKPILQSFFKGNIVSYLATFIVTCLIGISGVIRQIISLLAFMINNTWIAVISFIFALLFAVVIARLGGGIKAVIEKEKEKHELEKLERARETIKVDAKVSEKKLESYKTK